MSEDFDGGIVEGTSPGSIAVTAVTNFQIIPDNGGLVLLLSQRHFDLKRGPASAFPEPRTEAFAAGYMSHSMAKDLSLILARAVGEFERTFGKIPLPGVDPEKPLEQESE